MYHDCEVRFPDLTQYIPVLTVHFHERETAFRDPPDDVEFHPEGAVKIQGRPLEHFTILSVPP